MWQAAGKDCEMRDPQFTDALRQALPTGTAYVVYQMVTGWKAWGSNPGGVNKFSRLHIRPDQLWDPTQSPSCFLYKNIGHFPVG
jgi:hypothetical protein